MVQVITRKLVRDPVEVLYGDGLRYATQRWITKCDDWRDYGAGCRANFGYVHIGPPFPTEDSVPYPGWEPPKRSWFDRLFRR